MNLKRGRLFTVRRIATWQKSISGVDPIVRRLYSSGGWMLHTRVARAVMALLILTGAAAFFAGAPRMGEAVRQTGPAIFLWLIPIKLVTVFVHELGHALAVKSFGREVPRAGIGWYWLGPTAFVDTSDMWVTDRWSRIAVNLAGIHINLVVSAVAALMSLWTGDLFWAAVLWQTALSGYWTSVLNLNPLLEYDGYYVLADWLDMPNLRPRAIAWLGHDLLPALRTPGGLRGHVLDLVYGALSLAYIAFVAVMTIVIYRAALRPWVEGVMPPLLADAFAWLVALLVIVSASAALFSELRAPRRAPGP